MAVTIETNLPEVLARAEALIAEVPAMLEAEFAGIVRESGAILTLAVAQHTPYGETDSGQHLADTTAPEVAITGFEALISIHQTKTVYWRKEGIDYPLARLLIDGTSEHPITARGKQNGGADFLYWDGADHPVKRVMHPGTEPDDYPLEGYADAEPDIAAALRIGGAMVAEAIGAQLRGVGI